jgi:hypothetical protein
MEDEGLTGRELYNQDLTIEYLANHQADKGVGCKVAPHRAATGQGKEQL